MYKAIVMTKETNDNTKINKIVVPVVLGLIILLQVAYLFVVFAKFKQGFHSDEVFNYAFANSYETKELTETNDGTYLFEQWMDTDFLVDYLTVDENHRFAYDGPIRNAGMDLNPPFQYMVLHTISSFFPGRFSWYYCFVINIAAFIGTQIYLFLLTRKLTGNVYAAFAAVLLYGFGVGAMNTALFLRIYALAVFFAAMFAYYSHVVFEGRKEKKLNWKNIILLFVSCFLGAYTLHAFLMMAFAITLCYTLYYLFTKRWKTFFAHGFACLIGAGLTLILVPNTFAHVGGFSEEHSFSSVSYPFLTDLQLYLYTLTKDLFGIHSYATPNVMPGIVLAVIGVIAILMVPVVILVHKEEWFKKILAGLKAKGRYFKENIRRVPFTIIVLSIAWIAILLIVVKWTSYFYMGSYADRYLFLIYPLVIATVVSLTYMLFVWLFRNKKTVAALLLVLSLGLSVISHFMPDADAFFFKHYEEGVTFPKLEDDAQSIIVFWENWIISPLAPEIMHTDKYYATTYPTYKSEAAFADVDRDKPVYLLVDQHYILPEGMTYEEAKKILRYSNAGDNLYTEEDFLKFYRELDYIDEVEYVGFDAAFEREFKIYRLHFK